MGSGGRDFYQQCSFPCEVGGLLLPGCPLHVRGEEAEILYSLLPVLLIKAVSGITAEGEEAEPE